MNTDINRQLKMLFSYGKGRKFYSFANSDGKRWIMPASNMRTAMNLYQPSGIKGKLVKALLPFLSWNKIVLRLIRAEQINLALSGELSNLLEKLFCTNNLEFAVFCGTPCVHQKITMQISRGKKILGYAKFTSSEDIMQVFCHEKEVLDLLHRQDITDVPECLFCDKLPCGLWVFVQTTEKTSSSKVPHKWESQHKAFLDDIYEKTCKKVEYTDTDFCKDIEYLISNSGCIDEPERLAVTAIAEKIDGYFRKKGRVEFGVCHMDFTPWNMFEENGKLFVFDWEYARLTYPAGIDVWHFFVQTSRFEHHLDAENIWNRYLIIRNRISNVDAYAPADLSFKCYLLSIISLYLRRENGMMTESLRNDISVWLSLTRKLI